MTSPNATHARSTALTTIAIRLAAVVLVVLTAIAIAAAWDGPQCGFDPSRRCGGRHLAPYLIMAAWGAVAVRHTLWLIVAVRGKVALATESVGLTAFYSALGAFVALLGLAVVAKADDDLPLLGLAMALFIAFINTNPYAVVFDRNADRIRVSGTLWSSNHGFAGARLGWLTQQHSTQHSRFTTRHVALHFAKGPPAKISGETQDPALIDELSSLTGIPIAP